MIQLKQNNDIEFNGFILRRDGLESVGVPRFEDWEKVGTFISRSHEAVQFWRGDWLNYGENNFEDWTQYFDNTEPASETLRKEKWVSKRIEKGRRRPNLSWSHHEEVADLEPEEQDQMLDIAEKNTLSVHAFRKVVRSYKMKLDLPELTEKELEKTDPKIFEDVQKIIDASVHTVELLEKLSLEDTNVDARDYLISHLRKAVGFYFSILQKYDKQKSLSAEVV